MNTLRMDLKIVIDNAMKLYKNKVDSDIWRLRYHVMPPIGWMNDPNGVCYFNGFYHLFYQYSPLNCSGGLKFWGHAISKDLVFFKDSGIALYPDEPYDIDGAYSGSAFVENGKIHFFYTGNVKKTGNYDYIMNGRENNTIHAVSEDGVNFRKIGTVIKASEYPDIFTKHIRDPKVWKENGKYFMALGARDVNNKGQVILYRSHDLNNWEYMGISAGPVDKIGFMWECPDYIKLSERNILLISPQGLEPEGNLYQNIYQSGYFVGDLDLETGKFEHGEFVELDRGFDFYAPQTFKDEKGRRIMWAWMGMPDIEKGYYRNPTVDKGWQHAMTLPRELVLKGNKIIQKPLEEYKNIRKTYFIKKTKVDGQTSVDGLKGEVFELKVEIKNLENIFTVNLRQDTMISYCLENNIISLSHGKSGYGRTERKVKINKLTTLHIFSDTSSLEIFINEGEEVFTTRIYPEKGFDRISFDGKADIKIDKWEI